MLHPVGSQPPSVYWRRRIVVLGSAALVIVLLIITIKAVTSSGTPSTGAGAAGSPSGHSSSPSSHPSSSVSPSPTSPAASTSPSPTKSSGKASRSGSASGSGSAASSSAAPVACRLSALKIASVVAKSSYQVGDHPMLELQVTNTGTVPCVQDLADKQVVLKVYNGESRVWGSHDCEVQPGTALRTLAVNASVRVTITWSGFTSQPGNCKSRQKVGAGTYTLFATLAGKTGTATQFAIG